MSKECDECLMKVKLKKFKYDDGSTQMLCDFCYETHGCSEQNTVLSIMFNVLFEKIKDYQFKK